MSLGKNRSTQRVCLRSLLAAILLAGTLSAQEDHSMAGMNMSQGPSPVMFLMNLASGTSQNPESWPMSMTMVHHAGWNTMFMGTGFVVDTQQSGPRGGDKLFSANWAMATAEHRVGAHGAFDIVLMLSLDPATITGERYPLLFQTGETAYGKPIVDGQHPHNFIMGLGFHYARRLGENTILETYFAPVGDPALGPTAYPHRASAAELPAAPISHHWQDSSHIVYEVATVGISRRQFRLEASGFHGQEPGENRWTLKGGAMDSWSARLWWLPGKNWAAQVSGGRLTHPEALEPGDQVRLTASVSYTKPLVAGAWSSTLSWGRTHSTATHRDLNSYLAESVIPVTRRNFITGRAEVVDKDELFSGQPDIEQRLDAVAGSSFRIGAYTMGYTRDIDIFQRLETGIGATFTAYMVPGAIQPYYGRHPVGGNIFLRFRLRPPA